MFAFVYSTYIFTIKFNSTLLNFIIRFIFAVIVLFPLSAVAEADSVVSTSIGNASELSLENSGSAGEVFETRSTDSMSVVAPESKSSDTEFSSKALRSYISHINSSPIRKENPGSLTGHWTPPASRNHEDSDLSRHFLINYIVDIAAIDTTFMDNAQRINELREFLNFLKNNKEYVVDSVKFTGTASPDGYIEYNRWLSEKRLKHFKDLIAEEIVIPDSIIYLTDSYITWQNFHDGVAASSIPKRDEVLAIIDLPADTVPWYRGMHTDSRLLKLRRMDNGRVWETLKPILYHLRFADVEFVLRRRPLSMPLLPPAKLNTEVTIPEIGPIVPLNRELWIRRMYLKTNLAKWALLVSNISVEFDIIRHWTVGLDIFYSKWDYFKPEIRFRFAGFMPELRYWFNPVENDGWFIGGHFGYSYYNLGFNGKYRYQDLYGKTPTKGGGLSVGWRKQFGYKKRWRVEFSLGAGIYPLHYSVFENTHDYHNGQWLEERKRTYVGLDNVNISIGYAIDLFKKSVTKKQWWQ